MAGVKRHSNGEVKPVGPNPSTIRVSAPYLSQAMIEKKLLPTSTTDGHEKSRVEAREDSIRLQGVTWLDNTRRALQLPIRTFTTACVYYHKFRLAHPNADYSWSDASAASLLMSCKVEDTLKKSRDILAAAYNLKSGIHEKLSTDDPLFEGPSKLVIGMERLVLEAGGFDFRSRYPHQILIKLARQMNVRGVSTEQSRKVGKAGYSILTDLHGTFAPLKQSSTTMALAALELAAYLEDSPVAAGEVPAKKHIQNIDSRRWSTTREEIMETLLDALDLYTHHTTYSIIGQRHSLDAFLRIRLMLNNECTESNLPRYTTAPEPSADRPLLNTTGLRVANGHPTPVSPPQPGVSTSSINTAANPTATSKDDTLRFMLNPVLASEERQQVQSYFVEEWEEYEEEIQVPVSEPPSGPRNRSPVPPRAPRSSHHRHHHADRRDHHSNNSSSTRRAAGASAGTGTSEPQNNDPPRGPASREERDRVRDRERDQARARDRERDRRFNDERGRYDDRRYDRRYDDRRGRY